jgi:hypothetical protein
VFTRFVCRAPMSGLQSDGTSATGATTADVAPTTAVVTPEPAQCVALRRVRNTLRMRSSGLNTSTSSGCSSGCSSGGSSGGMLVLVDGRLVLQPSRPHSAGGADLARGKPSSCPSATQLVRSSSTPQCTSNRCSHGHLRLRGQGIGSEASPGEP